MLFNVFLHCLNMFSGILTRPAESLLVKFLLRHSNSFQVTEKMILAQQFIFALTFGSLTLTSLMWRIWWAPNNASSWQMGFNSAFKGLSFCNFALKFHLKFMKIGSLAFLLHFVVLLFFWSFIVFNSCSACDGVPQLLYYLPHCFSFVFTFKT